MAHRPVGAGSSFTFTAGSAATSSPFTIQSDTLRVVCTTNSAFVSVGATPSATNADYYIPSGGTATLALTKASNRVVGVITGTTTTIIVPEGTQVPFGEGDYVSLSASKQSYYNFTHQKVISVDTSTSYNGYYQSRMIVDYNSSGIITAFASPDATIAASNKVSAYGASGAGTIFYQQVQITGQA